MKKNYFLNVIFLTLFTSTLHAQIVYTDITDTTISADGESIDIDFNRDSTPEFTIEFSDFFGLIEIRCEFDPDTGFVILPVNGAVDDNIAGLDLNTPISSASNFFNVDGRTAFFDRFDDGAFPTGDTYVGAYFKLGANIHYGWIRVNWTAAPSLTIKDYAYQSTPNTAINAGDNGNLSVDDLSFKDYFSIYNFPQTKSLTIESKKNNRIKNVELYNLVGGKIISENFLNEKLITLNVSSFSKGVYIIKLTDSNSNTFTRKVLRQ